VTPAESRLTRCALAGDHRLDTIAAGSAQAAAAATELLDRQGGQPVLHTLPACASTAPLLLAQRAVPTADHQRGMPAVPDCCARHDANTGSAQPNAVASPSRGWQYVADGAGWRARAHAAAFVWTGRSERVDGRLPLAVSRTTQRPDARSSRGHNHLTSIINQQRKRCCASEDARLRRIAEGAKTITN
jgi:hypothetical protein